MPTFRNRQYVSGDRFALDPETGSQLRWGIPSEGGEPRWLLVGGSVVEATSAAPWRFRGLESHVEGSDTRIPLPEGTVIVFGNRLFAMRAGAPHELGTFTPHEEG